MPLIHYPVRKALSRADLPDYFTHGLYRVAPYQGCAHGCRYCDGRAERYYVEGDFERDIRVRENVPELFAAELPGLRESGMIVFGSGTTDPYQPCEASQRLTGRCAALLADYLERGDGGSPGELPLGPGDPANRVSLSALVLTKSALVLRDLEHWVRVHRAGGFFLLMTITGLDETVREHFEPGASPVAERLEVLRAFRSAGIPVGVLAMPLLPGVNDDEPSLRGLYRVCAELGVAFLMPGGLTLRPGRQKELYLQTLEGWDSALLPATRSLYKEEHASGMPQRPAHRALLGRLMPLAEESGVPWLLPHRVFRGLLPPHDALRILLRDMGELYQARGEDVAALKRAVDRYDDWLIGLRREFRRKRSLPVSWLPGHFAAAFTDGTIERVLDNPRTAAFARAVVCEGAVLEYRTLKLEASEG